MPAFHLNKLKLEMNVFEPRNIMTYSTGGSTTPSTTYQNSISGWTISGGQIRQSVADWGINKNVYQLRADGTGPLGAFSFTNPVVAGNWLGVAATLRGASTNTFGRVVVQFFTGSTLHSTQATSYQALVINANVRRTFKTQIPAGVDGIKVIPQMANSTGGSPSSGQVMFFDNVVAVHNKNSALVDELGWYETNDNPNLFLNSITDLQLGTSGWLPTSNVVEEMFRDFTNNTPYLRIVHPAYLPNTGPVTIVSNTFPVNSGQRLSGYLDMQKRPYDGNGGDGSTTDNTTVTLGFQYLDYNDNLLSNSGQTAVTTLDNGTWKTINTPAAQVPVATNGTIQRARMIIRVWGNTAGTADWTSKNTGVLFRRAALFKGDDVNEILGLPFIDGSKFRDILCGTVDIKVNRAEFDAQTLTARIIDETINPATLAEIEQGTIIRLSGMNANGDWVRMYTGNVSNFKATYEEGKTIIDVEATDIIQYLANIPFKENYSFIDPYFTGRNFFGQNGGVATSQIPNGTVNYDFQNDNASMLDQITTTRDSHRAFAWVDKFGTFQYFTKTGLEQRPGSILPINFSDKHEDSTQHQCYGTDADISFDPSKIINSLIIKRVEYRKVNNEEGNEEVVYGPYSDQTSINKWGARKAEITVGRYGFGADPDTYGNTIIDLYKNTSIRVNKLSFPVRNQKELNHALALDTYALVYVSNSLHPEVNGYYRITDIEHDISTKDYVVTVGLMKPDDLPALTGGQPALSTQNIGYIGTTSSTQMSGQFYCTNNQNNKSVGTNQLVDFSSAVRDDPQKIQNSAATFIIPKTGVWLVTYGIRINAATPTYLNGSVIEADGDLSETSTRWGQVKVAVTAGTSNITGSAAVRWQQGQQLRLLCNVGGTGTYSIDSAYGSTFITFTWLQD